MISLSLHLFHLLPLPFPSFSFLPRRKLFTRRILVAQDESGGYLLSIDRFWQHAKSFWPSLRGLTSPFIYPSFSLPFPPLPFFAPFSHRPHFFFDPGPSRHYFTNIFPPFIVLMRSLCRHALYLTDAFLFFPVFLFCLCILFALVILSREYSCLLYTSRVQRESCLLYTLLSFPKRFTLEYSAEIGLEEFIRLTY